MIDQVQSEFRIQTRCTHCGRLNWSRKKNVGLMGTCRGCGGKFTIAETALRTCPECRELMSAEDVVCKKCGHDPRADEQASALTSLAEVADATGEPAAELTYATETAGDVARRPRRYRAVPWVAGALDVLGAVSALLGAVALALLASDVAARGVLQGPDDMLYALVRVSSALGAIIWGLLLIAVGQGLRCIRDIAINMQAPRH